MSTFIEKVITAEKKMADDNKPFVFFALFERTDLERSWDLVASADWIVSDNNKDDIAFVHSYLKQVLNGELGFLARIVLLTPGTDLILKMRELLKTEHIAEERADVRYNETVFKRIIFITSK